MNMQNQEIARQQTSAPFEPTGLLANTHVQSLLASSKLRKRLMARRSQPLIGAQQDVLLDCGEGVTLHGLISANSTSTRNGKLAVLIHGWEGSAESTYLQSSASALYNAGFSVLRLHLRDHGPSSNLNTGLFHAARLSEVIGAIKTINQKFKHLTKDDGCYLVGFSLGGNFALRVSQLAGEHNLQLNHVVAVSPVISPAQTMAALDEGSALYRKYFIAKWKKGLRHKQSCFPEKYDFTSLINMKNLADMTDHLVEHYTPFNDAPHYYSQYTLRHEQFANMAVPTDLITAADDPVIPAKGLAGFSSVKNFSLRVFEHGGHCGFVKNWKLHSWLDDELLRLFN